MVNPNSYFSDWLREELEDRGWSQARLAKRTGLSRSAISMLVSGRNNPRAKTCKAIAGAFRMPVETVLMAADLLPKDQVPDRDPAIQKLINIMRRLPKEERQEIFEYAEWRFKRMKEEKGDT